jgi:hypothetical protein
MTIAKMQSVPLRNVWKHETDFTKWLQDNVDVLNEALDLSLTGAEREQAAGTFSVDLIADDNSRIPVIIENQLEKSNHDHLGKLLVYTSLHNAKAAIWIVSDPRPEHVSAVNWLNRSRLASFYLLKVEAKQIGNSAPAPLLTLIVGPSEEARQAGEIDEHIAERYQKRQNFWTQLLERAKKTTRLFTTISANDQGWISTGAGMSGLQFTFVILKHECGVELYMDRGKDSGVENKTMFDSLEKSKREIEEAYGGKLEWQRLDEKRACRIRDRFDNGGYLDEAKWPETQEKMISAMVRLEKALSPHIAKLKV